MQRGNQLLIIGNFDEYRWDLVQNIISKETLISDKYGGVRL